MNAEIIKRELLDPSDARAMFALHRTYFENSCWDNFRGDLNQKQWVILLREENRIVGFSTALFFEHDASLSRILFSGDTVVDKSNRRSCYLAGAFGHLFRRFRPTTGELYWLLICKGYRTYRYLPGYFERYFPGPRQDETGLRELRNAVAKLRFAERFSVETGIVSFNGQRDYLSATSAITAVCHEDDPYVDFFLRHNPNFRQGDELACIAPLSESNLNPMGKRVIDRTEVRWVE